MPEMRLAGGGLDYLISMSRLRISSFIGRPANGKPSFFRFAIADPQASEYSGLEKSSTPVQRIPHVLNSFFVIHPN